ncbi:hypothetical protein Dimus_005628 [Dionaea muscipula]
MYKPKFVVACFLGLRFAVTDRLPWDGAVDAACHAYMLMLLATADRLLSSAKVEGARGIEE